jgi:hypothetical protein
MAIRRFDSYASRWARPITVSSGSEASARAAFLAAKDVDQWTAQTWTIPGLSCTCESEVSGVIANKGVYGFAADQPRVDPGAKGLLVHEPRTYHLAPTRDIHGSADWTETELTATDNDHTSPDGDTQATRLSPSGVLTEHSISIDVTLEASTNYTLSGFIRPENDDETDVRRLNGIEITVGLTSGDVTDNWYTWQTPDVQLADQWQRWSTNFTTGAGDAGTVTITFTLVGCDEEPGFNSTEFDGDAIDEEIHVWGLSLCQSYLSGSYSIDTSATGLLSAYDFEGESLEDIKGDNDGTSSGTITFGSSRYGKTVSPGSAAYIDTGIDSTQIDAANDDHSVSVWFKVDSLPDENALIAGKGYGVDDNWSYPPQAALIITPAGKLRFDFYDSSNFTHRYIQTDIETDTWYHAVYTVDFTANTATLYLDGSSVGTVGYCANMTTDADTTAVNMYIGGHEGAAVCQESLSGEIANVEFYTSVLASGDVSGMYDAGKIDSDLGPFVQVDSLGAGVTAEAPEYSLTDSDILRPLNAGRLAIRFDAEFPTLPTAEATASAKYPLLTLYQDSSNYIEVYLQREENAGAPHDWILVLDDGSQTKSANGASAATTLRGWIYLYTDGSGNLRLADTDNDTLIFDTDFSGWSFSRMTFASIKLGCLADDMRQRHLYLKEIRTW